MTRRDVWVAGLLAVVVALTMSVSGQQAALRLLSSNGVKAAVEALQAPGEKAVGRPVAFTFGTSTSIRQRIAGGEAFDVAILTADVIDELTKAGKIDGASRVPLGSSGIGIGVRAGSARPDLRDANALKHVFLSVRSVTYASDGASRPSIERMFGTLGLTSTMEPKTMLEQGSVRAAARVVQGEAEMIITLVSEILPIQGLELAGPLPDEFQSYVSFAGAVSAQTPNADAARRWTAFLAGADARAVFTAKGIGRRVN